MNTLADLLRPTLEPEVIRESPEQETYFAQERLAWDPTRFGEEQIRSLVSQVFLPGWPKPARQVVFSAVEERDTEVAEICMQVGQALSEQVSGSVCVVQSSFAARAGENGRRERGNPAFASEKFGSLRNGSRRVSGNLWLVPADIFAEGNGSGFATEPLSARVAELRLDFDYAVLCGPPAGQGSQTALLGHLCDGVVLVLEANSTRRVAAQKAKEMLYAASARLLGTVLNQRTFPIPEGIYRKL
ncbi:MAG: hypothetical protein WB421_03460 [Terriglobales bacterium]|jgi:hypothetical protein